jgi:hypothetical protein
LSINTCFYYEGKIYILPFSSNSQEGMYSQIFETSSTETCCNTNLCKDASPGIVVENVFGKRNLCDLERIRNLILMEEDNALEVKEVLARVLEHYNTSVHYR